TIERCFTSFNMTATAREKVSNAHKLKSLKQQLHPRLRDWFFASFPDFTHGQLLCLPSVLSRESILLTSPTGSGKTLAGFLGVFDARIRDLEAGALRPGVRCVYISPLRAL